MTCIRDVTEADLAYIGDWLSREERDGKGFIHNWSMIEKAASRGEMIVSTSEERPVAFLTCGLSRDSILQVKSEDKRSGHGRALVEHALQIENARGNSVVVIQCEPKESIEFWSRMGFLPYRDRCGFNNGDNIYFYKCIDSEMKVSGDALHLVSVSIFPHSKLFGRQDDVFPDRLHYVLAQLQEDEDKLLLSRRISIVDESVLQDAVVQIEIFGATWFLDKAKREDAERFGIVPTLNHEGWYIEVLNLKGRKPLD